jgi:hypothetical protein
MVMVMVMVMVGYRSIEFSEVIGAGSDKKNGVHVCAAL